MSEEEITKEDIEKAIDEAIEKKEAPKIYVGQSEVDIVSVTEGTDLVGVLYKTGKNEDFTTEQWNDVKSDTPYPDGEIMLRKHQKLMVRILKLMVDARITMGEQEWLLEGVNRSIVENYQKSVAVLYNVPYKEKIFLYDIDQVLRNQAKE